MFWATLLIAICSSGHGKPMPKTVDYIELNHYYNDGKVQYSQLIFWEWQPDYSRFAVMAWAMAEEGHEPIRHPGGMYRTTITYKDKRLVVQSQMFRESHTTFDPERRDKRLMDEKYRVGLSK